MFLALQIDISHVGDTNFFRKTSSFIYFAHMLVVRAVWYVVEISPLINLGLSMLGVTVAAYIVYRLNNKWINMLV